MNQEEFWKIRAEGYNNLKWVNDDSYIKAFILSTDFNMNDSVLDVGTGTGVIAHAIAPLVKEVVGMDISQDMLKHSNWENNKYFIRRDIRSPIFCEGVFDKVTARMVFHHIVEDTQNALDECYRVLRSGGKMILSEGVPPSDDIKDEFACIFGLKEERLVFLESDLIKLMSNSGFKNIKVTTHIMKDFSVKDWLINSGLPKEKQDKIFEMEVTASSAFKKAHNTRIVNGDCLISTKNLIIVGEK